MDVKQAINLRKSIRSYLDKPIEPEKLDCILDAARMAPTASNQQSHKIITVTNPEMRQKMVAACNGQKMVGEAPVVLVVCANNQRDMSCGQPARVVDGCIALSFIMLQATELGLSTCWLGAFSEPAVRELLCVPDDYVIIAVTPLGYAAEEGRARTRNALETFVVKESF